MRKIILLLVFWLAAGPAYSAHSHHNWYKISETIDAYGLTVCTWECAVNGETHHEVTKNGGYCEQPR